MKVILFIFLCVIWIIDVAAMVAFSPLGQNVLWFSAFYCLGHVLMILLVLQFPADLTPRKSLLLIFFLGTSARLIFLSYPPGNDIFRYVWEGYIQNIGMNPYAMAPTHPSLADTAAGVLAPIWRLINQPDLSAAYPPFILLLFRAIAGLSTEPLAFKIVMVTFDIGVMVILMLMIKQQGIKPGRLLFYAINPLVLVYIAGEGHLDVIQVFFVCLALYLVVYKKYLFCGFLMLGLAVVSKYFALIALPLLVNAKNRNKSFAVLIPLILYIPYIEAGTDILKSLVTFASRFHYNDSIAILFRLIWGDQAFAMTVVCLLICLIWIYLFMHDRLRSVYLALGCLLLFLPTLHPWYLVLIAPFMVFFPSRAWLYLQAAVVFTFPVIGMEAKTGLFQEIFWLKWFEYLPFYILLIWGLFREDYAMRGPFYPNPRSISAIIPTLNEEKSIGRCIESLESRTALVEIIVADGGSGDKTREIAVSHGCRVVESQAGRGIQIAEGLKAASGDIAIILHADCSAAKGVFKRLKEALDADIHLAGGAFRMQFQPQNPRTRIIAFLNNFRTVLTGISFGDQAQFFRKEALERCGGFPAMMLMEDVELSLRLKEVGKVAFLGNGIVVSDRRWQGSRFAGNFVTVCYLFLRYLIERRWGRADQLMRDYYDRYYA